MCRSLSVVLKQDIWLCNLNRNDIKKIFENTFWRDVLISWSKINYDSKLHSQESLEIAEQYLWYNSDIRINNIPFIFAKAYHSGLNTVGQLFSYTGGLLSVDVITNLFELTVMQYNSIVAALPKNWKRLLKEPIVMSDEPANKRDQYLNKSNIARIVYKKVNQSMTPLHKAYDKWIKNNEIIEFDQYCELFKNLYKITNNSKLRSFQFRILHSAIITNVQLEKWKLKSNNYCSFCKTGKETVQHLLFGCEYVKQIWKWVVSKCNSISPDQIVITEKSVMQNNVNETPMHIFNFICLVTKCYIYSSRCLDKMLCNYALDSMIEKYRSYELFQAKKDNKLHIHCKKWFIENRYNGTGLDSRVVTEYINDT